MQARYGAAAAPPLRGVTPEPPQPGPASHLDRRKRGLVLRVTGPIPRRGEVLRSRLPLYGTVAAPGYGGNYGFAVGTTQSEQQTFPMPGYALERVFLTDCVRADGGSQIMEITTRDGIAGPARRVGCYLTCARCVPRCPPPYVP